jgi:hypothetical protein
LIRGCKAVTNPKAHHGAPECLPTLALLWRNPDLMRFTKCTFDLVPEYGW